MVIYTDKHGLPDSPGDTMFLPVHSVEAVHTDGVSCGLAILVNGGWGSLSLSPKVLLDSPIYSSTQSM